MKKLYLSIALLSLSTIGYGAVVSGGSTATSIAAGAVNTAAIADNAVTPAKISNTATDNFTFPGRVISVGNTLTNQLFVQTAALNLSSAAWFVRSDLTNGFKVDLSLDGYLQLKETSSSLQFYLTATNGTTFSNGSQALAMQPGLGTSGANRIDSASAVPLELSSSGGGVSILYKAGSAVSSSSVDLLHSFTGVANQSGTAGYTALKVNVTQTALGSGTRNLLDLQAGGVSKLSVNSTGTITFADGTTQATAGSATTNASLLVSGTLADARLSANVPLLTSTQTFTGNVTIPKLVGTTTNDSAATGNYGEYVSSSTSAAAKISATGSLNYFDVVSMSLTAGDWDITGMLSLATNGATVTTFDVGISAVAGNDGTGLTQGINIYEFNVPLAGDHQTGTVITRVSLSGSATYYLKCNAGYSVATPLAYGTLRARRIR